MACSTLTEQISQVGGESGAIVILAGDLFGIMLKFKLFFLSTKNVVYGILPAKKYSGKSWLQVSTYTRWCGLT